MNNGEAHIHEGRAIGVARAIRMAVPYKSHGRCDIHSG